MIRKVEKKNQAKPDKPPSEKQQKETKKSPEDLRKQIQDLETDKRNLDTEILLLKNDFDIQKVIKDLETKGGIQDGMLELFQDNILAYLRLQIEKLENSSITSNQKPTETQDQSQTEEKLSAAMKKVKIKDQKIMELENDIKKLTDKLKALEVHNSHSSERKKTDDNLKEAQREWENKYNAEVKKKETELNQIRKKVEDLEAEAKKQSSSSEQEKTIKSLKESQTEWQNKYKAAVKEKEDANDKLEKMKKKMEQLEAEANNLCEDLQQTVQRNKSVIFKLNEEITTLRKERDSLNKNIKDMEKILQTSSHSSEKKKKDDSLKELQREWENKYNAEVKEKETAINQLNQMRKKVEDLEAGAKKQSSSSEPEKTIKSLKEAQIEWQNKYKAAAKEKEDAHDKLEKMKKKMEQLEAEANNLWKSKDTGLKERNEKLSTELINVKRKCDELEKENVRLQKKLQELEKEKVRLQKSQGIHDMGSDELASSVADVCAFCASKGKLNPALYNCKACTEFGRYICGCCKENHDLYTQHNAARISTK